MVFPDLVSKRDLNGKHHEYTLPNVELLTRINHLCRKKMNFTTDLPKKDPIVSYIVASAVKCEKFFPGCSKEGPVFRMHAVILTKKPNPKGQVEGHGKKNGTSNGSGSVAVSVPHGK